MPGRVGRGGKSGGASGASGASGSSKAGKAFAAKVAPAESVAGASGVQGVASLTSTDPVTAQALELIRQLRSGELSSRDEATKKLVTDILRENVRTQSQKLADKIFEQLKEDPRLSQTLDRLWSNAQEQE